MKSTKLNLADSTTATLIEHDRAERQLALYADLVQESVSEGSPAETAERRGVSARETAR